MTLFMGGRRRLLVVVMVLAIVPSVRAAAQGAGGNDRPKTDLKASVTILGATAANDPPHLVQMGASNRPSIGDRQRRAAVQRGMAASLIVVGLELGQLPFEITTIPKQHMIEEFSAHRPDQALHECSTRAPGASSDATWRPVAQQRLWLSETAAATANGMSVSILPN